MTRVNITRLQQAELKIILLTRCGQVVPGLKQHILVQVGRPCRGALLYIVYGTNTNFSLFGANSVRTHTRNLGVLTFS